MGTTTTTRTRSWWGWGYEDQAVGRDEMLATAGRLAERFGRDIETIDPPRVADLDLRPPRLDVPVAFAEWCSTAPIDRAGHTYGKSYRDVVRAVHGDLADPPDVVAFPPAEADVVALLDWCSSEAVAAIPYGGGSSVVGGVECAVDDAFAGVVSIDLSRLDRVLEVDPVSRAARIQAGALGPVLEDQLRPARLHAAPLPAVVRVLDPRRLAGHPLRRPLRQRVHPHRRPRRVDAGRHPDRRQRVPPAARLGRRAVARPPVPRLGGQRSAIITEAWMRVQDRPRWRASAGVALRRLRRRAWRRRGPSPSRGCSPPTAGCSTAGEAATAAGVGRRRRLLVLGFESADHPVDAWIDAGRRAVPRPRRRRARRRPVTSDGADSGGPRQRDGAVGSWRNVFLRAPYLRDALVRCGVIVETFETACTWDALRRAPRRRHRRGHRRPARDLRRRVGDLPVHPRLPRRPGALLHRHRARPARARSSRMWDEIKAAASEALLAARRHDHPPPRRRPRPRPLVPPPAPRPRSAGRCARPRPQLDPAGILNPGVIV